MHIFWVYPIVHTDSYIPVQLLAVIIDFILLIGVAIGIVVAANSRHRTLLILEAVLFFFLVQVVLHAEARFRLPLVPLFCLFFGWGVTIIADKQRRNLLLKSTTKYLIAGGLITLMFLIYVYTGWLFMKGVI